MAESTGTPITNLPPLSFRRFVLCVLVATAASNVAWVTVRRWETWMWFGELNVFAVGCVAGPAIWALSGRRKLLAIVAGTFLGCSAGGFYLCFVGRNAPHVLTYMYPNCDPATWSRCLAADYLFVQPLGGLVTWGVMIACYRGFGGGLRIRTMAVGCLFAALLFIAAKANLHLCHVHLRGEQLGIGVPPGVRPWSGGIMYGLRVWGLGGYTFALVVLAALPVWAGRRGSFVDRVADYVFGGKGRRLTLPAILIVSLTIGAVATYPSVINHALVEAARAGDVPRAKRCIALGADLNAKDVMRYSALSYAVSHNRHGVIELLLAGGVDVNEPGPAPLRLTPLHEARWTETVLLLIRKGVDVNARDTGRRTPLIEAAGRGDARKVRVLLEHGADVNAKTIGGTTPFDTAKAFGSQWIIDFLRKHGGKTGKELGEEARNQGAGVRDQRSEARSQKEEVKTQHKR